MNTVKITKFFIIAIIILIAIYDIYLYKNGIPGDTISEVIWNASKKSRALVFGIGFAIGYVAGHLFWK